MRDERPYLEHIRESIDAVLEYTKDGRESLDDLKTLDAVIRRLQVMSESCLRLSNETQSRFTEVRWRQIRNFRNRLVHEYLDVDTDLIWTIVERNLPLLKNAVDTALADLE